MSRSDIFSDIAHTSCHVTHNTFRFEDALSKIEDWASFFLSMEESLLLAGSRQLDRNASRCYANSMEDDANLS